MEKRRVVITGLGIISPQGVEKDIFWDGLKRGKNCLDRIKHFDAADFPSQLAGEIHDFEPNKYLSSKDLKRMDRSNHFAIAASLQAIKDANLQTSPYPPQRAGVIVGTAAGGVGYAEKEIKKLYTEENGIKKMSSYTTTGTFCGGMTGEVSTVFNFRGPSFTISNGCNSSSDSIGWAKQMIENQMADMFLAGGAEACITPGIHASLCRTGLLSTAYNHAPAKALRPYDSERDGFVLSEGSWMFVLEELEHARERKAHIYAEIVGYESVCLAGQNNDHKTRLDEMKLALAGVIDKNHLSSEDIQYINCHGMGTKLHDSFEAQAIQGAFGKSLANMAVGSTKPMTGFPLGACGAAGLAATVLAMENSFAPPLINCEQPDPECLSSFGTGHGQEKIINQALVISLGLRSKSAVLAIRKCVNS